MGIVSNFFSRFSPPVGTPVISAKSIMVTAGTTAVHTVTRLLGSTSTLSLANGSNANLTLNATTGALTATTAMGAASSQRVTIREVNGLLVVEYPVTIFTEGASTLTSLKLAFAGSSTPEKYGTDNSATTVANAMRSTDGVNFSAMGTSGSGLLTVAKIMSDRTGLPAQYLMTGRGGTTVATDWLPAGSGDRKRLVDGIKAMGGCDALFWACGFNDVFQNIFVDEATHINNLRQLFALIRSETNLPNLKIIIGVSQGYTGDNQTVGADAKWTALRSAELKVCQDANNYFGTHSYDLPQGDGIHMTGPSYPIHAARWAENCLAALSLDNAAAETGPRVTAATAVYNTRTQVTITHSRGTDFTPTTGITGFLLSFDDGNTFVAPTAAVRVDATKINLTHAASGGATPTVYAIVGKAPAASAPLRDNSTRTLPINPTLLGGVKAASGTTTVDPGAGTQPAGGKTAKVAFSRDAVPPAGFNSFRDSGVQTLNSNAGISLALNDTTGAATGWTLRATNTFQAAINTQGTSTGNNSGPYPDVVMQAYLYTGNSANGDNGGTNVASTTFSLEGLNPAKTYTLKMFSARSAPDRKTSFTVNGTTQTVDAGNNLSTVLTFSNVAPDSSGKIAIVLFAPSGYSFAYWNVGEFIEN